MKRYAFSMEKVLRVRRLQEEAAAAAVAQSRRDEARAAEALRGARERYDGLAPASSLRRAVEFLALRDQGARAASAVGQATAQRHAAAEVTAAALGQWQQVHQRVEALERLDGRRREEHAVETRRVEDAAADEIVVSRSRSRR